MSDAWVAWLAEDSAEDDFLFASARFSGYIDLGDGPGEEIVRAGLAEALRWARERAPIVLVRLWDSDYFSAGERNPDPGRLPQWPAEGVEVRPRRPRGLEALDNTEADPPVLWELRLHPDAGVDETRFRAVVEADPRTMPVPPDVSDLRADGVRVLVRASTEAQATAIAEELSGAAHSASRTAAPSPGGFWARRGWEVYPFAPDAPVGFGSFATPE